MGVQMIYLEATEALIVFIVLMIVQFSVVNMDAESGNLKESTVSDGEKP